MKTRFPRFNALLLALCITSLSSAHAEETASTAAYKAGMMEMHMGMDIDYSGQVDSDFARGMKPHHQGARDMAAVELRYGQDPQIRAMAAWINAAQEGEIGKLSNWISRRAIEKPYGTPEKHHTTKSFKDGMATMHREMNIAYSGNADQDFVCGMIPHHQGAIAMALVEVKEGRDPQMLELASSIIRSQSGEIAVMQRWLKRKGIVYEISKCTMEGMGGMEEMHHAM
jgi:uncharacterized protein (DUF305 family)